MAYFSDYTTVIANLPQTLLMLLSGLSYRPEGMIPWAASPRLSRWLLSCWVCQGRHWKIRVGRERGPGVSFPASPCLVCQLLSPVWLFATPWTVAHQAPLSMGLSRQEYWSGLPCPPPGDLLDPGMEPGSPTLQADSLPSEPSRKPQ